MWRNPMPYGTRPRRRTSARGRRPTTSASAWGSQGLMHLQEFIDAGGVFVGVEQQRRVRDQRLHLRRQRQPARRQLAGRRIAAAHEARGRDEPARLRHSRQPRDVQRQRRQLQRQRQRRRRRTWRRRRRRAGARRRRARRRTRDRPTGRGTPDDPDVVQGRAAVEGTNLPPLPAPQRCSPGSTRCRPRSSCGATRRRSSRRSSGRAWRCASTLRTDCSSRACSTAAPTSRSAPWSSTCPSARATSCCSPTTRSGAASTIGSYFLVFNAILNFDSLNAGRKLDPR